MDHHPQGNPFEVIVLGAAAVDLVARVDAFPPLDGIVFADQFTAYPGGSGANIAAGLAQLGRRVAFYGSAGEDEYGRLLEKSFLEAGVDTGHFSRTAGEKSATCFIPIDARGNRMIFSLGGTALIDALTAQDLQTMQSARALVLSDSWLEVGEQAARTVCQGGGTVFFCPGGLMVSYGLERLRAILSYTRVLVLSRNELEALTASIPADEGLARLSSLGPQVIVVTLGKDGAWLVTDGARQNILAWPVPDVVDSTGAGDAFSAGMVSAFLEGSAWVDAVSFGSAAAAIKIGHFGARGGLPGREEVLDFMKRSG